MAVKTIYEWDIETIAPWGDILDHNHEDRLCDLPPLEEGQRLVLVRDRFCDFDGLIDRQWAYVEEGKLPERFDDGQVELAKVPQRFHKELARQKIL